MNYKNRLTLLFVLMASFFIAQHSAKIDSLQSRLTQNIHDTDKVNTMSYLSRETLLKGDPNASLDWAQKAFELAEKINFKRTLSGIYNNLGNAYSSLSRYPEAIRNFQKALDIRLKLNDKKGIAAMYNNIGIIYYNLADFPKTLEYFQKCLKMQEEMKNEYMIAASIGNIAVVYNHLHDDSLSLVYQLKSYNIHKKMGNKRDLVASLNNLCDLYRAKKQEAKAEECLNEALKIAKELDEKEGMKLTLANFGAMYLSKKQPAKALEMYQKSLVYATESDDQKDIASLNNHIASAYVDLLNNSEAITYYRKGFDIAVKYNNLAEKKEASDGLYKVYRKQSDFKNALIYHEISQQLNDSMINSAKQESLNSLKTQFALDRQETELKSIAEADMKKQEEAKAKQRLIIYISIGILAIVLVFSYFLFQRFKITRKQNRIIENQKTIVEEKNKEITDSIQYAKRLQQAIFPTMEAVKKYFPKSFIYFKPKDIVAGDFYWMYPLNEKEVLIAVADCTGHGVPGALVSVVCSNALVRAVKEFGLVTPAQILDKTRELVLETFAISGDEIKDGMDISLLKINSANSAEIKIEWAGANNPVWYISQNVFHEIKGDKQPIGKSDHAKPFTSHQLSLQKESMVFLFTDGFADQFGGLKGKKFKYKQMVDLFMASHNEQMENQLAAVASCFEAWKGDLEQVDDVCVIGIKL